MDTLVACVNPLVRCVLLIGMWAFVSTHKVGVVGTLLCCFVIETSKEVVCGDTFAEEDMVIV